MTQLDPRTVDGIDASRRVGWARYYAETERAEKLDAEAEMFFTQKCAFEHAMNVLPGYWQRAMWAEYWRHLWMENGLRIRGSR